MPGLRHSIQRLETASAVTLRWTVGRSKTLWSRWVAGSERRKVRWINKNSLGGRSAHDSGLREGDVVVALAGEPLRMNPQQFNLHIKLNYKVGDVLPLTVLRDGKKRDVKIKLVE